MNTRSVILFVVAGFAALDRLSVGAITSKQIIETITATNAADRDKVANRFIGLSVDWNLSLWSANRVGVNGDRILVVFWDGLESHASKLVLCNIPIYGHEGLLLLPRGGWYRVTGRIEQASVLDVTLTDASIKQESAAVE